MRGFSLVFFLLIGALSTYWVNGDHVTASHTKESHSEVLTAIHSCKGDGILVTPIKVVSNSVQLPEYSKQNSYVHYSAALVSAQKRESNYYYALCISTSRSPAYIVFRSLLI